MTSGPGRPSMNLDQFAPLLPFVPVVTGVAGAIGLVLRYYAGRLKNKIRKLEAQLDESRLAGESLTAAVGLLTTERDDLAKRARDFERVKESHECLSAAHAAAIDQLDTREKEEATRENRVRKALELEGAIWTQPVMAGTYPFVPLAERRTPIVSVLNLKGGVGKTTLTAYLAWALADRGYRVLLVDLDLQGSLSSFFLSGHDLRTMEHGKGLLRHYLDAVAKDRTTKLLDYVVPVPQLNPRSCLVATTDKLAYSELGQTFQWLLRVGRPSHQWNGRRDVRMLLRRALHAKGLANRFDIVLLDCPPLVNLCCANALAASDFVLVPVTPNVKAIERVTPLLKRMIEVQETGVNPGLGLLGLVVNRHQNADLTPKEKDLLKDLPQSTYDILKTDAYIFDTTVPQRTQFRDAEDAFVAPEVGSDVRKVFETMAEELTKRLPQSCRQPSARSSRGRTAKTGGES